MAHYVKDTTELKQKLDDINLAQNCCVSDNCRICKGTNLKKYLDLGNIPLVNSYVKEENVNIECSRYPLQIYYCEDCSMSQLSIVVKPEILFKEYFYRSSISKTFVKHCSFFAKHSIQKFNLTSEKTVLDIASNDGAALNEFKKQGVKVLGVDPAENLAKLATESGIPTVPKFWNEETAKELLKDYGKVSMITAMNVFAHVNNVDSFVKGVNILLEDNGIFAIEVPYLLNFMSKNEFDTSYHEHLSYFLLKPLLQLFSSHGMQIFDIKNSNIHGGSIRVYVKKECNKDLDTAEETIDWLLELERSWGLHSFKTYSVFSKNAEEIKNDLLDLLVGLKKQGKIIAAYGASAKGNVLSNYCNIGNEYIDFVVDDTPEKQGLFTPGNHLPIVNSGTLDDVKPDYLLLFAWNFADELMAKTKQHRGNYGLKYIIPIPEVKVI